MTNTTHTDRVWSEWNHQSKAKDELARIPENSITEVLAAMEPLRGRLYETGHGAADAWLGWHVEATLELERDRRIDAREKARVLVEANGHEMVLDFDEVLAAEEFANGNGWTPICTCGWDLSDPVDYMSREEAEEALRVHAEVTDGKVIERTEVPA